MWPINRLRYRLRTLFVVALLVSGLLGFLAQLRATYRSEQELLSFLAEQEIGYHAVIVPVGPKWVTEQFGQIPILLRVTELTFSRSIATLGTASGFISPGHQEVADEHLALISDLEHLRLLHVDSSKVTDDGVEQITHVETLECLEIVGMVSNYGLRNLARLVDIERLVLSSEDGEIANGTVQALEELRHLEALALSSSELSDQHMLSISELDTLTEMDLSGAINVTDAGVRSLSRLSQLERLTLSYSGITDESISTFTVLPSLKYLDVHATEFSESAVKKLRHLRPDLEIEHGF